MEFTTKDYYFLLQKLLLRRFREKIYFRFFKITYFKKLVLIF